MRSMPAARWIGASATSICMVEQFGLAMMPRGSVAGDGIRIDLGHHQRDVVVVAEGEVLSITTAPAAANFGAYLAETEPPAENSAMSTPANRRCRQVLHHDRSLAELDRLPAERSLARATTVRDREVALGQDLSMVRRRRRWRRRRRLLVCSSCSWSWLAGSGDSAKKWLQAAAAIRASMDVAGIAATSPTSPHCARWRSAWSISTSASMASAIGVARMPTQGSWRPVVTTSTRPRARPPARRAGAGWRSA
jgi:hypothetical protein